MHLFIQVRGVTSNIQVNELFTNKTSHKTKNIDYAQNLKLLKEYYLSSTGFRCAIGCNEIEYTVQYS